MKVLPIIAIALIIVGLGFYNSGYLFLEIVSRISLILGFSYFVFLFYISTKRKRYRYDHSSKQQSQ